MCIILVDDLELVNQRHVCEIVSEIIVVMITSGILINETAFFQTKAFAVVRVRCPVAVVEQYVLRRLYLRILVVQERLFQRHAVEIYVFLDVTTVGGIGL